MIKLGVFFVAEYILELAYTSLFYIRWSKNILVSMYVVHVFNLITLAWSKKTIYE